MHFDRQCFLGIITNKWFIVRFLLFDERLTFYQNELNINDNSAKSLQTESENTINNYVIITNMKLIYLGSLSDKNFLFRTSLFSKISFSMGSIR